MNNIMTRCLVIKFTDVQYCSLKLDLVKIWRIVVKSKRKIQKKIKFLFVSKSTFESKEEKMSNKVSQYLKTQGSNLKHACTCWNSITFRKGDADAFTQLFLNNMGTTLVVASILKIMFNPCYNSMHTSQYRELFAQFPTLEESNAKVISNYVMSRTVVGLAISLCFGSLYYTWLALRLKGKNGNGDMITSLPFGVNTPAAFAFVAGILIPTAAKGFNQCYTEFETNYDVATMDTCLENAIDASWKQGVISNFVAGFFGLLLSFAGSFITTVTPRVALLSSLATIGIAFLLLGELSLTYADPISGMLPFMLMIFGYFCDIRFWSLPITLVVVVVGCALAWMSGQAKPSDVTSTFGDIHWTGPTMGFSALGDWSPVSKYLGTIIPFAIQASVGTLMNVSSAKKAGDSFPVKESMIVDGLCSMVGAIFGTPLMSSVYIGHPGYKAMGATTSYTLMNSISFLGFALFGLFAFINGIFPPSALAPVIVFVGLIICSEAMDGIPQRHNIVFLLGLLPGICDWAAQNGMFAQGTAQFGYIALGGPNAMLYAMILCAIIAFCTDRNWFMAMLWSIFAALCSAIGLIHQDTVSLSDFAIPHDAYCLNYDDSKASVAFSNITARTCNTGFISCNDGEGCGYAATTQWRFMTSYFIIAAALGVLYVIHHGFTKPDLRLEDAMGVEPVEPAVESDSEVFSKGSDDDLAKFEPALV